MELNFKIEIAQTKMATVTIENAAEFSFSGKCNRLKGTSVLLPRIDCIDTSVRICIMDAYSDRSVQIDRNDDGNRIYAYETLLSIPESVHTFIGYTCRVHHAYVPL